MKFKKSDLTRVLSVLSSATDTVRPQHKYVQIKFGDDKAEFFLSSSFGVCTAEVSGTSTGKKFTGIYAVNLINSYIKSLNDDEDEVIFEKNKLILPFAEYTFESFMLEMDNRDDLLKGDNVIFIEKVSCIPILEVAESFASASVTEMNKVMIYGDKVVASDRRVSCIINTDKSVGHTLQISVPFIKILRGLKISEFQISCCEVKGVEFYKVEVDKVKFYMRITDSNVDDYSKDEYKSKYEHDDYIVVDRAVLYKALGRMSMVVTDNPDTRIYLKVQGDKFYIENRDHSQSKEIIAIKAKFVNHDVDVAVSCRMLLSLTGNLKFFGNDVYVYLPKSGAAPVIKLETEQHNAKFIQAGLLG